MADDLHERAMKAAGDAIARSPVRQVYERADDIAPAAIHAYFHSLTDQGDPLVRVSEIMDWLRERPACGSLAVYENALAAAIQRKFAPERRKGSPDA
jgi:hypothetical protein